MDKFKFHYPVKQYFGKGCAEDALEAFIEEIGMPSRWSEMGRCL